ncbi:type II secretion system minor pseudopilin GspK [Atopomonas sediminilitoris]|uniref:type II secretion system minor pseudopilin GspK n=1 Tax=Atopomonas sediminilitoris TaxID=2919919 RepID=UPI001F4EEF75|nr:type II secretion system minor pseudopilin GspK [Atopomonas sediminilitoris]
MKRAQQGVALITVLLIVALVTVVSAAMISRQQLTIRAVGVPITQRQALHYALGGERLAQALLQRDALAGNPAQPLDHLQEAWAKPLPAYPVDGGEIQVRIEDVSGRFNLNSLLRDKQVDQNAVQRLQRLLLRLDIRAPYAQRLADWLDADQEVSGEQGAEDGAYLLQQPPYRAGNRLLADASEMRLLLGMSDEDWRKLAPWVSALPAQAPLNINTASALLLSTLADPLTPDSAKVLVAARGAQGYPDVAGFLSQSALAGMGVAAQGLSVGSHFFTVTTLVRLGDAQRVVQSTLQRDAQGKVHVLGRDFSQRWPQVSKPVKKEQ